MRSRTLAFLLLPLASAACVSAKATYLGPHEHLAPVPEAQVRVLLASDSVPPGCQRLALIHTSGDADFTSESQMIRAAKRRAGAIGANAVQLLSTRDPSTGTRVAAVVFGFPANRKGQLLALTCPETQAGLFDSIRGFFGFGE